MIKCVFYIQDCDDELPKSNVFAFKDVYCSECNELLHSRTNERMQDWVHIGTPPEQTLCMKCCQEITSSSAFQ